MNKEMQDTTKKIVSEKEEIWLEKDNIIWIKVMEGSEFDEKDVKRHFASYSELGFGKNKKALLFADGRANFTMTKEARDFGARQSKEFFIAIAIISNSLPTRMLINFLNSFYDFGIPLKLFADEKEALLWLQKNKDN